MKTASLRAEELVMPLLPLRVSSDYDDDLGEESSMTPRRREFLRRNSAPAGTPLLQVAASTNGRLGLATSTMITIKHDVISYGRYDVPIDQIERAVSKMANVMRAPHMRTADPPRACAISAALLQGYDETTCTLLIKFAFRSKPKHFTLENATQVALHPPPHAAAMVAPKM